MIGEHDNMQPATEGAPRWMGLAVVGLAVLSLVGIGWRGMQRATRTTRKQALAAQSAQSKSFQQNKPNSRSDWPRRKQTNAQMQGELNLVGGKLKLTEGQVAAARNQVKQERAPTIQRN